MNPCPTLEFIRAERIKAWRKNEHAEVMRRIREEDEHIAKCATCAMKTDPLYLQLWPNARIGIDTLSERSHH